MAGAGRQLDDLSERVGEPQRRIDPRRCETGDEKLTDQDRGQRRQQETMAARCGARGRAFQMPGFMRRTQTMREPTQQKNRRSQSEDGDGGESDDKSRRNDARLR